MTRTPFVWEDTEHFTGADLMETVALLVDENEATDFMEAYEAVCDDREHAEHNVKYLCSLIEDGGEQLALFGIEHDFNITLEPRQWFANGSSVGVKVEA